MEYAYSLSAAAPRVIKYRIDQATSIVAGVPVIANSVNADDDGVAICTTTAALGCVGLSLDAAGSTAAQVAAGGGFNNDGINAGFVSVAVNPDACFRAKLSGAATEDTALVVCSTAQAANSAGTTITGCTDEFTVWGYTGANAGHVRRATAANTIVNAMPYAIAANDIFLEVGGNIGAQDHFPQLSTACTQYNALAAADTDNDNFIVVEFQLRDVTEDGRNNSYAILVAASHAFSGCHGQYATGIS